MSTCRDRFVVAAFLLLLAFPVSGQVASDPWLILADGKQGSINAHTTREDLVRAYGANNVVDGDVDVGEGEVDPGTILFPSDPENSIEILWNDVENKTDPGSLTIRGNKSRWKALHEISLGTTLKQLERLNGRPFHMAGYGWDYSGTVMSWDMGMLTHDLGQFDPQEGVERGRIILRLDCDRANTEPITKEEGMQIAGDRNFSSHHPVLQKMNPCVSEMVWVFPRKTKN
jgi:hypothetical protein